MNYFELWLDESGNFENDGAKRNRGLQPSLVGGLLIKKGSFSQADANRILPESGTYHSVEENDQMDRFKKIKAQLFDDKDNRMIVFSNQEGIMVLDNNLTYLNIITEGILKLIEHLKASYGNIFLDILVANRVDTTTGLAPIKSVVPRNEYLHRLEEKLIFNGWDKSIDRDEWALHTASARKDKRLMLADIVCNTFLTRGSTRTFTGEDRILINQIYNDPDRTERFSVFESALEKAFKNSLIENKIGEAVSTVCLSGDHEMLRRCFDLLEANFETNGIYDIRQQYTFIKSNIDYYLNIERDFDLSILFLKNIQKYYIRLLRTCNVKEAGMIADSLDLDINFYLMTVYTHLGEIEKTEFCQEQCSRSLDLLPPTFENIGYRIRFEGRKVTHLINLFAFEEALSSCEQLVIKCRDIDELLKIFYNKEGTQYEELGKSLGNLIQIKAFMLRTHPELYASAIEHSEEAIQIFENYLDDNRQYLYRVNLETEARHFDAALEYLLKSVGLNAEEDIQSLCSQMKYKGIFVLSAYIRLMAEGSLKGWERSEALFAELSNSVKLQEMKIQRYHPAEIIYWKLGTYFSLHGQYKTALSNYHKATEICFYDDAFTLNVIGLGVLFESCSVALKYHLDEEKKELRTLRKRYEAVHVLQPNRIEQIFGAVDLSAPTAKDLWTLSRKITY